MRNELLKIRDQTQAILTTVEEILNREFPNRRKLEPGPPIHSNYRLFHGGRLGVDDDISSVWNQLPESFTIHEVKEISETKVGRQLPLSNSSYSAALSRLVKEGYLEILSRSSGRRPAVYRRLVSN